MKKIILITAAAFFSLLVNARNGYSEINALSIEAALSGGYLVIDDDNGSHDRGFARLDLGVNVTRYLGVELSLSNTVHSLEKVPDVTFYSLGAVWNIVPESALNPYILVGAGAGNFNTDILNNESEFVINGGFGVKYFFEKELAFKVDFRDSITTGDVTHNYSISAGIMMVMDIMAPFGESITQPPPVEPEVSTIERSGEAYQKSETARVKKTITSPVEPEEMREEGQKAVQREDVEKDMEVAVAPERPDEIAPVTPDVVSEPEQVEVEAESTLQAEEKREEGQKAVQREDVERDMEVTIAPVTPDVIAPAASVDVPGPEEGIESSGPPEEAVTKLEAHEEIEAGKIIVLHKGLQVLIHFPEKSSELDDQTLNLLSQLLSIMSKKSVARIQIYCYSYDYANEQLNNHISEERAVMIRRFFIDNSSLSHDVIKTEKADPMAREKFGRALRERPENVNRAYIIVTFE